MTLGTSQGFTCEAVSSDNLVVPNNRQAAPTFDRDSVADYEAANGKRPAGHGAWAFTLGRDGAYTTYSETATYTDAKRNAMREARMLGCATVTLES